MDILAQNIIYEQGYIYMYGGGVGNVEKLSLGLTMKAFVKNNF